MYSICRLGGQAVEKRKPMFNNRPDLGQRPEFTAYSMYESIASTTLCKSQLNSSEEWRLIPTSKGYYNDQLKPCMLKGLTIVPKP